MKKRISYFGFLAAVCRRVKGESGIIQTITRPRNDSHFGFALFFHYFRAFCVPVSASARAAKEKRTQFIDDAWRALSAPLLHAALKVTFESLSSAEREEERNPEIRFSSAQLFAVLI